jgi:hypothetical protein
MKRKHLTNLLSKTQLGQILRSARCHYRFLLKQEKVSDAEIAKLERRCSRPSFRSLFYKAPAKGEKRTPKIEQRITIEHLIHSISVFESVIEDKDVYRSFLTLYEVASAQGALFSINADLWWRRSNAGKAAEAKRGDSRHWIAKGRALIAAYLASHRRLPTRHEVHGLLETEMKKAGVDAYSYPWVCKNWMRMCR